MGLRSWAYQVVRTARPNEDPPLILTTFPKTWFDHYVANQYNLIDPVVANGPAEVMPFLWRDLTQGLNITTEQKQLFDEAADAGLANGIGVPIHGAYGALAITSMVSDMTEPEMSATLPGLQQDLHFLSFAFHNHARSLISVPGPSGAVELTPRERECLLWAFRGKSAWEIGMILGITQRTVHFHMTGIRQKFGVATIRDAVVRAILDGLIEP